MTVTLRRRTRHKIISLCALIALFLCIIPVAVMALTPISQGFWVKDRLPMGSIVSLEIGTTDRIEPSINSNVDSLLGVIIDSGDSLITLTNGGESQQQVATSGVMQVLVSDVNGPIVKGDHITASPVPGVGMKATGNVKVIGIAQDNLTSKGGRNHTYKDYTGKNDTILLNQIPVLVEVGYFYKTADKTIIPSAIQNIANALAGKKVNTLPILISAGIFIIMLVVVSSIIYSMIRSSIISVGRNPMSQSAIYRDLLQISALVVGIIIVAAGIIYLILGRL